MPSFFLQNATTCIKIVKFYNGPGVGTLNSMDWQVDILVTVSVITEKFVAQEFFLPKMSAKGEWYK